jgi:Tol biopolymer transport system component
MQIYSFDLNGGHERPLTTGSADHHYPSLSPDATRLVYTGEEGGRSQIYTLDLRNPTATPFAITQPPMVANSASWSPDGSSIIYSALIPGQRGYQIFKAGADGTDRIQLTTTLDSGNASPTFSPDGTRIAYINGHEATLPGTDGATMTGMADRIWVMDADGSGAMAITPGPRDAYPAWLDPGTVVFARALGTRGTQMVGVGVGGRETAHSPPGTFLIEPKPLPDGKSYGATQRTTTGLRVVTVSRADRAALESPAPAAGVEFVITPIPVPPHDGSVFTIAWILAPAPAAQAVGGEAARKGVSGAVALGAAALVVIAIVGLAAYRRRTH